MASAEPQTGALPDPQPPFSQPTMKTILRPMFVLALALTAACGDSPTDSGSNAGSGSLSFTYASNNSPVSGVFSAEGSVPKNGEGTWAGAVRQGTDAAVLGNQVSGSIENAAIMGLPGVHVGPFVINENCDSTCASLAVVIEKVVNGQTRSYLCAMTEGTINVTSLSESRIRGTFAGTGACASLEEPNEPLITITNGSFDTPLVLGEI